MEVNGARWCALLLAKLPEQGEASAVRTPSVRVAGPSHLGEPRPGLNLRTAFEIAAAAIARMLTWVDEADPTPPVAWPEGLLFVDPLPDGLEGLGLGGG